MKTKKEKKAVSSKPVQIDVKNIIQVHMVFDGPSTKGWVHTHGMWEAFQLPDLEIVEVSPLFLMVDAGRMLNHIAQYMVDAKTGYGEAHPVSVGQRMGLSRLVVVQFDLSTPLNKDDKDQIQTHYESPRWRISPIPEMYRCENPAHKKGPNADC